MLVPALLLLVMRCGGHLASYFAALVLQWQPSSKPQGYAQDSCGGQLPCVGLNTQTRTSANGFFTTGLVLRGLLLLW